MMDKAILLKDLRSFLSRKKPANSGDMITVRQDEKPWGLESKENLEKALKELGLVFDHGLLKVYEDHIKENKMPSFSETLLNMIDQKEMKDSDVYRRAGIDRRLFWKIRNDDTYQTSKRTVFALILSLRLSEEESEELLESAGYSFSRSQEYDLIILFFVRNAVYDFELVNYALTEHRLQPLGCIEG